MNTLNTVHIVRGHYHQGASIFRNPGVQCTANVLTAFGKGVLKDFESWNSETIDSIL